MLSFNQLSLNFACKSISWRICQFQKVFRGVIGESGQESWAQKFPGNMKLTCVCGNFQKWLTIGCMVRVDMGVIMFKSIIISSNNYISGPLKRRSPQLFRKGRWMTFHSWANLSRGHCFSRRPRFRQTQDGWQGKDGSRWLSQTLVDMDRDGWQKKEWLTGIRMSKINIHIKSSASWYHSDPCFLFEFGF